MNLRIGTRTSTLAMWQARKVEDELISKGYKTEIVGIKSSGDKSLGGDLASTVGQFIHAVDSKLLLGEIDIAVHSSKDVPVDLDDNIKNLAYLERGCTNDLLIFKNDGNYLSLGELFSSITEMASKDAFEVIPKNGMVGTVSGRRQSFMLNIRPDIIPISVRGQVETRLKRLKEGRIDGIILAEIGLARLNQIGALEPWILEFGAIRIKDSDWPTAPGQGSISVHCKSKDYGKYKQLREILNHKDTESNVTKEREILHKIGGGCKYPAGVKVDGNKATVQISEQEWRTKFSDGLQFESKRYIGKTSEFSSDLPEGKKVPKKTKLAGPKLVSTLNSERLATVLANKGINVVNKPVIDLNPIPENWPVSVINEKHSRSKWPLLVLTSPFAAKCAIEISKGNSQYSRIQWIAIGEGTARACFKRGVTVSICAKARNSVELSKYIDSNISRDIPLLVPKSNVGSNDFVNRLESLGFSVQSWVGYENNPKDVYNFEVNQDDVLLLSSPSSAKAWAKNGLPIPTSILCMGQQSLEQITSMDYFSETSVEVLQGPTADFVSDWWKTNRGGTK